jgi:signal transduction histidine kinase
MLAAALGVAIARRGPAGSVVGGLLALEGMLIAYTAARVGFWEILGRHPETAERLNWLVALLAESSVWIVAAVSLLLLFFPDGRLPSRRWRVVAVVVALTAAVHHVFGAFDSAAYAHPLEHLQHPFAPAPRPVEWLAFVSDVTLFALLLVSAASVPLRARRASPLRRRQLKWLALAGAGLPVFIVSCLIDILLTGHAGWLSVIVGTPALAAVPIAIAIALLRHDLYDVDRAVATTITYACVTALLLAAIALVAAGAGVVVGGGSSVAAAAVSAIAVLAFVPLRGRIQRRVDRKLYPLRQAALTAIHDLERAIQDGSAAPELLADRLRVALRDPGLCVAYVRPGTGSFVDETGARVGIRGATMVTRGGTPIGALVPTLRHVSEGLLRDVAAAAVTLVELVQLRLELSAALHEVEASRARLLQADDEARRTVARDLHDGAQQRLVSLGMALRVAQRHLDDGGVDMGGLIDQAVAELGTAVAELREIAHGLRPSTLDDGLAAALRALTRGTPIPVGLDVRSDELPESVSTTLYFVVSEAIANAVKHADATRIDVTVSRADGHVEVRISDDGRGGATVMPGSGLAGMRERVSALGGRLVLMSDDHHGTVVEAVVPCAS